jgi:hypothetical protein
VRSSSHRESDVDVGVLVDRRILASPAHRFDLRVRLTGQLSRAVCGLLVDLVVSNDAPPELARKVATEGRCIFATHPEMIHALVRDAQLRAADLAPFLARTRRLKLEALKR